MIRIPIDYNIIGPRIAQARRAQNMSKEEFCNKLESAGIHMVPYVLSLIENQEAQIFDYQMPAFAKALGISIDWLFEDLNNVKPYRRSSYE